MEKKKSKTKSKTKSKAKSKSNGKPNGKPKIAKAPEGSGTIAFTAYPEHLAAVDFLAQRDAITRSAAARMLIEKGKSAMRLRVK